MNTKIECNVLDRLYNLERQTNNKGMYFLGGFANLGMTFWGHSTWKRKRYG